MRRDAHVWPIALLLLLLTLPLGASDIGVKSLSGPPTEFEDHRLPQAGDVRVPTNLLMLDGERMVRTDKATSYSSFSTSPGTGFSLVQVTTSYPNFSPTTFTAPNGSRFVFDGRNITCNSGSCGSYTADIQTEAFVNRAPGGVAIFSISGGEVSGGTWGLTLQDPPLALRAAQVDSMIAFDENVVSTGIDPNPCGFDDLCLVALEGQGQGPAFELVEGVAPVLGISFDSEDADGMEIRRSGRLDNLRVRITELQSERLVHDDTFGLERASRLPVGASGSHLVRLPSLPAGNYSVRLDLEAEVEGLGRLERTAFQTFPVLPESYRLAGRTRADVLDRDRLRIHLDLDKAPSQLSHLYAYAEVWTAGGEKPIAWIGGMTYPELSNSGQLSLPVILDGRWLALSEARDSQILLRNVRLQDPETFIPVDQKAELRVVLPSLPRSALLEPAEVVLDASLYLGQGDVRIPMERTEPDTQGRGINTTGIFLVHGWCSVPAWPFNDFVNGRIGGTEIFNDPSASRSHDAFARRIRDQGDALFTDSFSVVAHSQGGAASTHLRAFYNSGLDNSLAPRPIQSMGTPYGGSTLMDLYLGTGLLGWLVSEIFGLCGQQFSLGTLGSIIWKSSIPNFVRSEVFYFRTRHQRPGNFWQRLQFWRWRCNAASFVIPGSDDGVVSVGQGSFSHARDQGITDRECHTGADSMNHPDQKDNVARNDEMDREGRPQPQPLDANCRVDRIWHPNGGPTGQGYFEYWIDASDSQPGLFPISTFTWTMSGGITSLPTTNPRFGPLFPGLPGQASNYIVTVIVTDTSGATSSAICSAP